MRPGPDIHLFVEDLVGEDVRDLLAHRVRPDDDLHGQSLADEVADGVQLVRVEVDRHQEQHLAEGGRQPRHLINEGRRTSTQLFIPTPALTVTNGLSYLQVRHLKV